jgi:hypothetical protein
MQYHRLQGPVMISLSLCLAYACVRPGYASDQSPPQWRDPKTITPQPSRSSRLTPEQKRRVAKLQRALAEVDDSSTAKWQEDFEKDRDPEKELRTWEAIAAAYQSYCSKHPLGRLQKLEVLKLLLVRSTADDEQEVLRRTPVTALTRSQAAEVIRGFKGDASPIEVERK